MSRYSESVESKYEALTESIKAQRTGWEKTEWQRLFGRFERHALRRADAYWWSSDIIDAVRQSAPTLPGDTKLVFMRFESAACGWWWFESPIMHSVATSAPCHGLLWHLQSLDDGKRHLAVTTYGYADGVLCAQDTAYFDEGQELAVLERDADRSSSLIDVAHREGTPDGLAVAIRDGKPNMAAWIVRLFIAGALWIEQTIVVPHREQADRHSRKRILRDFPGSVTDVHVVRLRRTERQGADYAPMSDREYTCRWLVRGHWRQQYYPSRGERSPIWIMPYIKGPDDMPIKTPSATVFACNR